jgi:manganese transport protein
LNSAVVAATDGTGQPPGVTSSLTVRPAFGVGQRLGSLFGPGALIAVGYMDPGNWATAIAGGARYGYRLLWVVAAASLVAMLLQWVAARIGVVTGSSLARLCRERLPRRSVAPLWLASEVAIVACDVAEVVGSAVALQILLHVPLWVGVLLSAGLTLGFLALARRGLGLLSTVVAALIALVAVCLVTQLAVSQPRWIAIAQGLQPSAELLRDAGMAWLAAGIVGATVMPHNLYLHSALAAASQRAAMRAVAPVPAAKDRQAVDRVLRAVGLDSTLSLFIAFLVNAALLILAASVFQAHGQLQVDDLAQAHRLLSSTLPGRWPGIVFAVALLVCGINSMLTGTLAGQVVMEGFLDLRMSAFRRALLTRGLAIVPALLAVTSMGEHGSAQLLVASQVLLSLQLPFAMLPMLWFACDARLMGPWRLRPVVGALAWLGAASLVGLNALVLWQMA